MIYRFLADAVVVAHLGFVLFVVLGGLTALRWPRLAWVHLPAAAWGALIELTGGICPLTPLEHRLRVAAGGEAYSTSFVEHYVVPLLYPGPLTRGVQVLLGCLVIAINLAVYGMLFYRVRRRRGDPKRETAG